VKHTARDAGRRSVWKSGSIAIDTSQGQDVEYYDLSTDPGELTNAPTNPNAVALKATLVGVAGDGTSGLVATELQAPLPASMQSAQAAPLQAYTAYVAANGSGPRF
jgi:hypothetical protein